jgi:hypothetical protein
VRQDIAVQRVEGRVIDVGREDALFKVIEDDDPRAAAQSTKRSLVEPCPDR